MVKVVPVPVRDDNYAYLLIDPSTNKAAAVDPWDVSKVSAAAKEHGVEIVAALTTHHHHDHSGGNPAFASNYPGTPIYGGSKQVQAVTHIVGDKDELKVTEDLHIKCLATPCHTQDSICYYATTPSDASKPGAVFTGDTLFIAGCGRFFEGDSKEMNQALTYLGSLPAQTVVYNGHEYTGGNLAFAKSVDAKNPALNRLATLVKENEITAGKTTIQDEKEWNPFMRLDAEAIKTATKGTSETDIMAKLREMKNNYRG